MHIVTNSIDPIPCRQESPCPSVDGKFSHLLFDAQLQFVLETFGGLWVRMFLPTFDDPGLPANGGLLLQGFFWLVVEHLLGLLEDLLGWVLGLIGMRGCSQGALLHKIESWGILALLLWFHALLLGQLEPFRWGERRHSLLLHYFSVGVHLSPVLVVLGHAGLLPSTCPQWGHSLWWSIWLWVWWWRCTIVDSKEFAQFLLVFGIR